MSTSSSPDTTREALLLAATQLFAEQGYAGARVREIAERAGANVAAINYHFGGKQALYLEVLRRQASVRIERYPLPAADAQHSQQALHRAIEALLSRMLAFDDAAVLPRLMVRELAAPTDALPAMVRDLIAPQLSQLQARVRQMLGDAVDEAQVRASTFSIVSQCFFYLFARPLVEVLAPQTYDGDRVPRLARHIADFSIGALQQLRVRGDTP